MLSWKGIVQDYIILHSDKIRKTTKPLRDHFGVGYFTYHRIDNQGKYTVLVDRPDWAEHYVSNKMYYNDPYLRNPSVYQSGICLVDNHGSDEFKETVLKAGKQVLNMDLGAMVIQKNALHVEFFGFWGSKETSALEALYLNHPRILTSFAEHFRKELSPILSQMEKEAGNLIDLKGKDFACNTPIHPKISPETLLEYYKDVKVHCKVQNAALLSAREKQCLRLLTKDKTLKEIAAALGLSKRTVESYFENIKNKLVCWSKQEVLHIARALEEIGLL